MLCNYSSPVAPGEERVRERFIPQKQKKKKHHISSLASTTTTTIPHPSYPLFTAQWCSTAGGRRETTASFPRLHRIAASAALRERKPRQEINVTHMEPTDGRCIMQVHLHTDDYVMLKRLNRHTQRSFTVRVFTVGQ